MRLLGRRGARALAQNRVPDASFAAIRKLKKIKEASSFLKKRSKRLLSFGGALGEPLAPRGKSFSTLMVLQRLRHGCRHYWSAQ
jgi:hypothetical protein